MDDPTNFKRPRSMGHFRWKESNLRRHLAPRPSDALMPANPGEQPVDDPGAGPDEASVAGAASAEDVAQFTSRDSAFHRATEAENMNDELPAAFRLTKVYTEPMITRSPLTDWRWLLLTAMLVGGGMAAGYLIGSWTANLKGIAPGSSYSQEPRRVLDALTPETLSELDAAFDSAKHGRSTDARQRFAVLRDKHPEWPSMALQMAQADINASSTLEAQRLLSVLTAGQTLPDADFVLAQLDMVTRRFDLAETAFATAVAIDPTRADLFYSWGECLRVEGKTHEAIGKFRSALLRNRYPVGEGFLQLKLWLSVIQADKEEDDSVDQRIDAELAWPHPPFEALFASAARSLKARRYAEAANLIARAQDITEPVVFHIILSDPAFAGESLQPQMAVFYK